MLITIEKKVPETIDVKTPCWLKNKYSDKYCHITKEGHIVIVNNGLVAIFKAGKMYTNENIFTALKECEPCPESEFNQALSDQVEDIKIIALSKETEAA